MGPKQEPRTRYRDLITGRLASEDRSIAGDGEDNLATPPDTTQRVQETGDPATTPTPFDQRDKGKTRAMDNDFDIDPNVGQQLGEDSNLNSHLKMQLELAKLRRETVEKELQLEHLRRQATPNNTTSQTNDPTEDAIMKRIGAYNPDSTVGKQIKSFLQQAKLIVRPPQLAGSSNYTTWKESILSKIETPKCHFLLINKEDKPSSEATADRKLIWEQQNS
jgi:hypothetical protein